MSCPHPETCADFGCDGCCEEEWDDDFDADELGLDPEEDYDA